MEHFTELISSYNLLSQLYESTYEEDTCLWHRPIVRCHGLVFSYDNQTQDATSKATEGEIRLGRARLPTHLWNVGEVGRRTTSTAGSF